MVFLCLISNAQNTTNRYRIFMGVGNTNSIADFVTLTDKSFMGELSGQLRFGIRLADNYELNFGVYGRKYPDISKYPGMSYNKFLGYSGAFMYEFRKPDSRWGLPFGIEAIKFERNLDSTFRSGGVDSVYFDHYSALSYGPKIGVRCHFGKYFFIEAEVEILYEKFKWEIDWYDKNLIEANSFTSFKFIGISANLAF